MSIRGETRKRVLNIVGQYFENIGRYIGQDRYFQMSYDKSW